MQRVLEVVTGEVVTVRDRTRSAVDEALPLRMCAGCGVVIILVVGVGTEGGETR